MIVCLLFVGYSADYYRSFDSVDEYYAKQDEIHIEKQKDLIIFDNPESTRRLIFYPGAKVEYDAYVPLLYEISKTGIDCYLLKMPFNVAFFGINKASEYIDDNDKIYLAGHSLGASMICEFAKNNGDKINGIILFAGYSASDLSELDIDVLSIYGSEDQVLNQESYVKNKDNLPNLSEYVIDGGNHAGFGYYGPQKKDGEAIITKDEQIKISANVISEFIK